MWNARQSTNISIGRRQSMCNLLCYTVVIMTVTLVPSVQGIVDYCSEYTFRTNTTWLQFTKEISTREYVIVNKFKSLHCCAKGYRSIEWYKDGRAYPWPAGVSNFILYPESANQTIYSKAVGESDSGNYSCLVRNDTHMYWHNVNLTVIDAVGYTGSPLPTYEPQDQFVQLGDDARLFCEAFVGRIDLPDAHNEADWRREDDNTTLEGRFQQRHIPREDKQILGTYLLIHGVTREDLGQYWCRISNTWFQSIEMPIWLRERELYREVQPVKTPYKQILLLFTFVILSAVTLAVFYLRFGLQLRVLWKDTFFTKETNDGKEYDVLVCYEDKDSHFVLGVLVPTLESRYNYSCVTHHLSSTAGGIGSTWPVEMNGVAQRSRRLLAIVSPALLQDNWNGSALYQVLHNLLRTHSKVICITLKPLPKCDSTKNEQGESVPMLLRAVHLIEWREDGACGDRCQSRRQFWSSLRLHLPPMRQITQSKQELNQMQAPGGTAGAGACTAVATSKKGTVLSNSHESLEVLV